MCAAFKEAIFTAILFRLEEPVDSWEDVSVPHGKLTIIVSAISIIMILAASLLH